MLEKIPSKVTCITTYQQLNELYLSESYFCKTGKWALKHLTSVDDESFLTQTGYTFDELAEEIIQTEELLSLLETYAVFAIEIEKYLTEANIK